MPVDRNTKILLVEDSGITRRMELKALNEVGFHNVVEASDGLEAIKALQEVADIGLIISDWNMPGKDGFELLRWVRSQGKWSQTPFIMATARGEKKETAKAGEAGVSSFITKPFGPGELDAVIEGVFGPRGAVEAQACTLRTPCVTPEGKLLINVAHIQITDHLVLGALKHLIAAGKLQPKKFELETRCMAGWNPVQQALEKGDVDAAFVLAPIAMDLFSVGTPIRLALLAHKNGSICVRKKKTSSGGSFQQFFRNKTFYLPHAMSIHHMLTHMFLREIGLKPGVAGKEEGDVTFEVIPPVRMIESLAANPDACGFMVAEPMGTKAIAEGIADLLFLSGELWENHPCCVFAVRDEIIDGHADALQEFTSMLVQAGQFVAQRPDAAAEIGVAFLDPNGALGLRIPILKNVLKESNGIRTRDLFPIPEDFERMQQYMVNEMGIGTLIDVGKFVDTRFAETACSGSATGRRPSSLKDLSKVSMEIVRRQTEGVSSKDMLSTEGKYLFFTLNGQDYGVGIFSVREVVQTMPVRTIPHSPDFVKGVINLRGKVIPLIDLGIKFGLGAREYAERTCTIILEIRGDEHSFHVGIVVDSVSEVKDIRGRDVERGVSLCGGETSYIKGLAKQGNTVRILLDVEHLFNSRETDGLVSLNDR